MIIRIHINTRKQGNVDIEKSFLKNKINRENSDKNIHILYVVSHFFYCNTSIRQSLI